MSIQTIIQKLKDQKYRITKARVDIITLLGTKPMDIHELENNMSEKGHPNVQTIYNNISFLERENLLFTTLQGQSKIYHLAYDTHESSARIHIKCNANKEVFNLVQKRLIQNIRQALGLQSFNIDHLDITIQGECIHEHDNLCQEQNTCMLKKLVERNMI